MPKVILTKTLLQKSWSTRPILFFKYALRWFQLFPKRYIGSKNYFRILHQVKPLSVTNISVDSRTAAAATWTLFLCSTWFAASVREPTLLFVTEMGFTVNRIIKGCVNSEDEMYCDVETFWYSAKAWTKTKISSWI